MVAYRPEEWSLESVGDARSSIERRTMLLSHAGGMSFGSLRTPPARCKSGPKLPTDVASGRLAETKQQHGVARQFQTIAKQAIPIEGGDFFHLAMPNGSSARTFLVASPVKFWLSRQLGNPKARGSAFLWRGGTRALPRRLFVSRFNCPSAIAVSAVKLRRIYAGRNPHC